MFFLSVILLKFEQMFVIMCLGEKMKIEKIQKKGMKYKITLDNGEVINTFDDVILENNLLFDKFIDSDLLNKINTDTIYYESYHKALKMIERRLRSEFEIRKYLDKNAITDEDKEKIVDTLKRIGLIDDLRFAKAYTNDKMNLSLDGPFKIAKNLEEHKIDKEIISQVIAEIDEDMVKEHLNKIVMKKVKANTKYSEFILKQKLMVYLVNLGYAREDINEALADVHLSNDLINKEMEKMYNKLSKKYDGDELIYKLKNKLYSKGFKMEDINNFIEKTVH